MKLFGDKSGKGFGKKREAVKESDQKQPFNTRLNPTTESTADDVTSSNITVEEKRSYITPRARREAELDEKIARLKEEEDLLSTDPSVGAVPELVADRMIGRIVAFFGIPVFGGERTMNSIPSSTHSKKSRILTLMQAAIPQFDVYGWVKSKFFVTILDILYLCYFNINARPRNIRWSFFLLEKV